MTFLTSAKLSGKNVIKTVSIVFGVTLLMSLGATYPPYYKPLPNV